MIIGHLSLFFDLLKAWLSHALPPKHPFLITQKCLHEPCSCLYSSLKSAVAVMNLILLLCLLVILAMTC